MVRSRYEPKDHGWICITDVWHSRLAHIDCSQGGAQEAYADLCRDFERAGWELERRVFDRRYVRRNDIRLEIEIGDVPTPRSNLDERGFMALIVEHGRQLGLAANPQGVTSHDKEAVQQQASNQNRQDAEG
jgi:hypothetical protein